MLQESEVSRLGDLLDATEREDIEKSFCQQEGGRCLFAWAEASSCKLSTETRLDY